MNIVDFAVFLSKSLEAVRRPKGFIIKLYLLNLALSLCDLYFYLIEFYIIELSDIFETVVFKFWVMR